MRNDMNIQNENIIKLIEFTKQNPELRIVPMVDVDCVPGDDYAWFAANWCEPKIEEIYSCDEAIYIKSQSYDDLVDKAIEKLDCSEERAKKVVGCYDWEKVIAVKIKP